MKSLSVGKVRGLQQIADADGIFTICAMDHRESMVKMIAGGRSRPVDYAEIVERKLELCDCLASHATAVLLDPIFGAAQCISRGVLPEGTGLLVSMEATGYTGGSGPRLTRLLDGWGVEKIRRMGASAVKILVYYRPDLAKAAQQQRATVDKVATDCIKHDIPFLVEPKTYTVGDEAGDSAEFAARKEEMVIETAREITALPIDVLKVEFPGDLRYKTDRAELIDLCRRLDASSRVPWVVLSAGVDYELFCQQVEIACRAGASGFLGGRAVWQEAMAIEDKRERVKYLSTVAVDRLRRLTEIAEKYAVPWPKKLGMPAGELTPIPEKWYEKY